MTFEVQMSEEEWRTLLGEEAYQILRQGGTEPSFTGRYLRKKGNGIYQCAGCRLPLFASRTKFDSGTGWPSFYDAVSKGAVLITEDSRFGMVRNELLCRRCGGHLGHVFSDGPKPTGQRYCINSLALHFEEKAPDPPKKQDE